MLTARNIGAPPSPCVLRSMSLLRRGRRRLDARASANTPDGDKLARAAAEAVKGLRDKQVEAEREARVNARRAAQLADLHQRLAERAQLEAEETAAQAAREQGQRALWAQRAAMVADIDAAEQRAWATKSWDEARTAHQAMEESIVKNAFPLNDE